MTTQTTIIGFQGPGGGPPGTSTARRFTATSTDATTNEQLSSVGSLSLYKVMKGAIITHAMGQFAAGIGLGRIRNTSTNKVKAHIIMDAIGEEKYRPLDRPVAVEENDIVEVYCDVA
jgi:hypothetical protein